MHRLLTYNRKDTLAFVILTHPPSNDISLALAQELKEVSQQLLVEDEVRVVVLTGSGDVFCAGSDLEEAVAIEEAELAAYGAAQAVAGIPQPVVCAINGPALGQGLELALACDLRIASERATFGMPQVHQGVVPWDGGTQRLPRVVGRGKALELLLLGQTIDAQEAWRIQLVHRVVQAQELLSVAEQVAGRIASFAPIAARYAKETIHKGMEMPLEQGLRLEADMYFILQTTEDRMEGIRSFQQRRPPTFRGK